jgi:hypothetical protein
LFVLASLLHLISMEFYVVEWLDRHVWTAISKWNTRTFIEYSISHMWCTYFKTGCLEISQMGTGQSKTKKHYGHYMYIKVHILKQPNKTKSKENRWYFDNKTLTSFRHLET